MTGRAPPCAALCVSLLVALFLAPHLAVPTAHGAEAVVAAGTRVLLQDVAEETSGNSKKDHSTGNHRKAGGGGATNGEAKNEANGDGDGGGGGDGGHGSGGHGDDDSARIDDPYGDADPYDESSPAQLFHENDHGETHHDRKTHHNQIFNILQPQKPEFYNAS
jgi:hypothetical protein